MSVIAMEGAPTTDLSVPRVLACFEPEERTYSFIDPKWTTSSAVGNREAMCHCKLHPNRQE
jgi:hypothetical protein